MSVTRDIVKGVVKPIERNVEFDSQVISLLFNGTDQYAEHEPWTPSSTDYTQSLKYTPYTSAMGVEVTILGDHLVKNASDELVYSYTDSLALPQTVTLSTVTLNVGVEHIINILSDGDGISLAIGADEATNSAVVDPTTLSFETWMRDSGGTDYNNGVLRDVEFIDSALPSNSRSYTIDAESNIQPDSLNADGPELFNPVSLDSGWTDNLDGSYSWDSSGTDYINCGSVLTAGRYYLATFEIVERTGTGAIGFSISGVVRESHTSVGVHSAVLVGGTNLRLFFTGGSGIGTVRNVSVRETTSAEILDYDPSMVNAS